MNETGPTARDEEAPTAEARWVPAVAESHPVVDQKRLADQSELPPPRRTRSSAEPRIGFWRRHSLFFVTVVLPMAIAAGFLLFVATPRYSSTASFIVRSIDESAAMNPQVLALLGSTVASDDTYVINTYLTSRDLVDQLVKNDNLRAILGRPEGDFVFRYPTFWLPDNNEFMYRRFQWMVTASVDATGISTIEVNAFTPDDARALAEAMLRYAEALVNRMNERLYQGQVAIADRFVAEAQKKVDAIEAELKAFRDVSGSLDPNLVAQSELNVIEGLSTQLAQVEASIVQQLKLAPTSPTLAGLRAQARSYRDEIKKEKLEIAGAAGSEAVKLQTYDLLTLRRGLALQALADAVGQRELARQDAERHHLYVQLITQPNLAADWPRYPQTTFDLITLLGICLQVFQVLRKLNDFAAHHLPYQLMMSVISTAILERPTPSAAGRRARPRRVFRGRPARSGSTVSAWNIIRPSACVGFSTESRSKCAKEKRSRSSGATGQASPRWSGSSAEWSPRPRAPFGGACLSPGRSPSTRASQA